MSTNLSSLRSTIKMTIINPWAYANTTALYKDIVVATVATASRYLIESLTELYVTSEDNTTLEIVKQAEQLTEMLIAKLTISNNSTKYFLFRLNPNKLDKSFTKIRDNKLTGAGLVQDTHGNNGISYTYSGTMGNMRPALSWLRVPQLTPAWYYLQLFERFFLEHDQDLIFLLDDEVIIGRFNSFSYGLDANNPWLINYRFDATMYPDTKFGLLDGYVGKAFDAIKPDLGNSTVKDPFKGGKATSSKIDVFNDTYGKMHAEALSQ